MRVELVIGVGLVIAGCGTNNSDDTMDVDCSMVTGTDTFVVGLEHAGVGGALDFKLMSADPAPPARGDNTWIVQINSMASGVVGDAVNGASLVVTPFMPAHQHGSPITVQITPEATSGQYQLSPVNLWMPGVWETTVQATSGPSSDRAVFKFCIP
jgi:hypothetical protein